MLQQLKIKDFAIIDDLTISFQDKMTVLTGETGSGKSIIIDAINLLLGERASSEAIRYDKDKAIVEGLFFYNNPKIETFLNTNGIESDHDSLIIVREIAKNGRNICRINGNLVTVNQLKQLGSFLVDVHVQHDTTRLITTNNYLYLIDMFTGDEFKEKLDNYQLIYNDYLSTLKKYREVIKENKANQEKTDFYQFQLNEFKQAHLSLNEYEELNEKQNAYANFDKLFDSLNNAYQKLSENKLLENIYESANTFSKLSAISTKYNSWSESLFSIYYQLDDFINNLSMEIQALDYNPKELDKISSRLNIYSTFKRKYRMEIEDLINYEKDLRQKMDNLENFDFIIKNLQIELKAKYEKTLNSALELRTERIKIARNIENELINHLHDLKLANTTFNIVFNEIEINEEEYLNERIFTIEGLDLVDFHVSFNLGEPTKPLSKIASGGELSRFMLGLKTILTEHQKLSTVIFDEIDTGVSGITAQKIAQKIKTIAENTQVLCISHLPQVAAISDNHLYISKVEENNRTHTIVKTLSEEERINEIAKMIAGENVNEIALINAKNLLQVR